MYVHPDLELEPLLHVGTGSFSEQLEQPRIRPDQFETGTLNTVGIAGLSEGVEYVIDETVEKLQKKKWNQIQTIMEELRRINGVTLYGPSLGSERTGIVSFNLKNSESSQVGQMLDQKFGIAVR
ncbi:aminotransferase class V-fold PLP-dependent enzyme [Paenibacillus sp. FSL H7-0331]|uniref:aminotransferase class V-fold PLP-dependent enzyme n=1 Tax=Paenibacillus sp. FSL H7-0331 TaxID=1920421 RepID=UPI0021169229|nr:aminotransferase class V-fold PLP-dependent enzyme [Paenibacillus sp. FSL H7-0331]